LGWFAFSLCHFPGFSSSFPVSKKNDLEYAWCTTGHFIIYLSTALQSLHFLLVGNKFAKLFVAIEETICSINKILPHFFDSSLTNFN